MAGIDACNACVLRAAALPPGMHTPHTHFFLDGPGGEQAVDPHLLLLALPPHTRHGLQIVGGVPVCGGRARGGRKCER